MFITGVQRMEIYVIIRNTSSGAYPYS